MSPTGKLEKSFTQSRASNGDMAPVPTPGGDAATKEHDKFAKYCRTNVDAICASLYRSYGLEECVRCAETDWNKVKKYCDPSDHFSVIMNGDSVRHSYLLKVCSPRYGTTPTPAPTEVRTEGTCENSVNNMCKRKANGEC